MTVPLLLTALWFASAAPPAPRTVDVPAPDGAMLKATYYAAAGPGPGVLLLHMCNTTRQSWDPVGPQLSAAGIHALASTTVASARARANASMRSRRSASEAPDRGVARRFGCCVAYLLAQPGVDTTRVGAAGGSCGVNQAVQLAGAIRTSSPWCCWPEGPSHRATGSCSSTPSLRSSRRPPPTTSTTPMRRNRCSGSRNSPAIRATASSGSRTAGTAPRFSVRTRAPAADRRVVRGDAGQAPADPSASVVPKETPVREFWTTLHRDGVERAVQTFHAVRQRDPDAFLFPEGVMNQGIRAAAGGEGQDAIALFTLNVAAYPASANAQDSLGDGTWPTARRIGRSRRHAGVSSCCPPTKRTTSSRRPFARVPRRKSRSFQPAGAEAEALWPSPREWVW